MVGVYVAMRSSAAQPVSTKVYVKATDVYVSQVIMGRIAGTKGENAWTVKLRSRASVIANLDGLETSVNHLCL